MARRRTSDPLLAEIEHGLMPGRFISYNDMFEFTRDLESIEAKIASLVNNGEAERAVGLYEIFLAGCYDKMEECDDLAIFVATIWPRGERLQRAIFHLGGHNWNMRVELPPYYNPLRQDHSRRMVFLGSRGGQPASAATRMRDPLSWGSVGDRLICL